MNYKPILIISGEPNSIFLEIFKSLKIKIKTYYFNSLKKIIKITNE